MSTYTEKITRLCAELAAYVEAGPRPGYVFYDQDVASFLRRLAQKPCPDCDGQGLVECPDCDGTGTRYQIPQDRCAPCEGLGQRECDYCEGSSFEPDDDLHAAGGRCTDRACRTCQDEVPS